VRTLDRLRELGFELPEAAPRHEFVPVAYLSLAMRRIGMALFGLRERLRGELDLATARQAAVLALLGCLRAVAG
jgi:hypothetical protein